MKHAQIAATLLLTLSVACGIPTADDYDCGIGIQRAPDSTTTMDITWFAKKDHYYFVKQTSDITSKEWAYFPYAAKGSDAPEGIQIESNNDLMLFRLVYTNNPASDLLELDLDGDFISVADELDYGLDLFENFDTNTNGAPDDWENTLYNGTMPPDADFDGDRLSDTDEFAQNRNPANCDQDSDGNLDYIFQDDLIFHWNVDESTEEENCITLHDISPNHFDLIEENHFIYGINIGVEKNGSNSYLTRPKKVTGWDRSPRGQSFASFSTTTDEIYFSDSFTISLWLQSISSPEHYFLFQSKEQDPESATYRAQGFMFKAEQDQITYLHGNDSIASQDPYLNRNICGEPHLLMAHASQTLRDGKWHHLVFSFSTATGDPANGTLSLYMDGTLVSTLPNLPKVNFTNPNSIEFLFCGFYLDDFAAYHRALSAAEITQLTNGLQLLATRTDSTPPSPPTNPSFSANYPDTSTHASWTASTDDTRLNGYILARNNKPYRFLKTPNFADFELEGTYRYTLRAFDYDQNLSPPLTLGTYDNDTTPAAPVIRLSLEIDGIELCEKPIDFGTYMRPKLIIDSEVEKDISYASVLRNDNTDFNFYIYDDQEIDLEEGQFTYTLLLHDKYGAVSPPSNECSLNVLDFPFHSTTATDYPLYNFMASAQISLDPVPAITLSWPTDAKHASYLIYRKAPNESDWEYRDIVKTPATQYTDTDITLGQIYEYQIARVYAVYMISGTDTIGKSYVTAAIKAPLVDQRGGVLLVIDDTVAESLRPEIDRLKSDLTGDGWASVAEVLVPRHAPAYSSKTDTMANPLYAERVQFVKDAILNHSNSDPVPLESVILLGRVPVPFSGTDAWDGHSNNHYGAWPADTYYADITRLPDEDDWTDSLNLDPTSSTWSHNRNLAGDGKFDNNFTPSALELAIGRIDLAGLAEFAAPEVELLRNYLNKDHDFRHARLTAREKGIVDADNAYFNGMFLTFGFADPAFTSFAALFGHSNVESSNRDGVDYFGSTVPALNGESYLFGYGTGPGSSTRAGGLFNGRTADTPYRDNSFSTSFGYTADFADYDPQIMFSMLFGSYFGDWAIANSLLRAPLAADTYGLSCIWAANGNYTDSFYCHRLALGETLGESLLLSQNDHTVYDSDRKNTDKVIFNLMGDPTLRVFVCPPPQNPAATATVDSVTLTWQAPAQPVTDLVGYHIYRKTEGSYQRLTPAPISERSFTDSDLGSGSFEYMIRSIELRTTGSGSFYNASQAVFATASIP